MKRDPGLTKEKWCIRPFDGVNWGQGHPIVFSEESKSIVLDGRPGRSELDHGYIESGAQIWRSRLQLEVVGDTKTAVSLKTVPS